MAGAGRSEAPGTDRAETPGLDETDRAVLAFAARGWSSPGARERAIRERLDMSPTRYFQLLNALLDDVHALAYDPVTVNRLRRERQERRDRTR
ncbi:DUF3263 domain-containing protein [Streptomyces iconiensis]|uniref:DUF3263 domain-containing protein n=1 Tax=Streptomyces iconiensis TaxID=1384038 RepID=A0ABT7A946_9ACTN|nr:DUF3263 domain-containing protein [Streptomyces iconiensis]MDJ1137841.1 DUF3263 domain-containing protein [Streptomyces iconiensis]